MKWSSKFHAATNGEGATCTLNLSDAPLRDEDSLCDHQNKRHRDPDRAGTVSPPPTHPQLGRLTEPHSSLTTSSSPSRISSSATSASEARSSLHPARRARC